MLKAHGISRPGALVAANNGDGNGDSPPATPTTPGKRKAKGETTGSAKKPRTPRAKAKKESDDEEEPKPKSKASATKRKVKKEEVVEKKEEEQDEASAESPKSLSGMRFSIHLPVHYLLTYLLQTFPPLTSLKHFNQDTHGEGHDFEREECYGMYRSHGKLDI